MVLEIVQNVLIAFAAIFVFTLIQARASVFNGEFNSSVFWDENKYRWLWTMLIVLVVAIVNGYAPENLAVLTNLAGIQFTAGEGAFATLAVLLFTTGKQSSTISRKKAKLAKRESKLN